MRCDAIMIKVLEGNVIRRLALSVRSVVIVGHGRRQHSMRSTRFRVGASWVARCCAGNSARLVEMTSWRKWPLRLCCEHYGSRMVAETLSCSWYATMSKDSSLGMAVVEACVVAGNYNVVHGLRCNTRISLRILKRSSSHGSHRSAQRPRPAFSLKLMICRTTVHSVFPARSESRYIQYQRRRLQIMQSDLFSSSL